MTGTVLNTSPGVLSEGDRHRADAPPRQFFLVKRIFDVCAAIAALPIVLLASLILLLVNPLCNPGPLFYTQKRMGWRCQPFWVFKFRTMSQAPRILRGPFDPVENDRITSFGQLLRRTRIDELPQFANVLMGDMSVVGPRPDYWDHAIHYVEKVPGYRRRYSVRPGITGLAQVDFGYADGARAVSEKTRRDLEYLRNISYLAELHVLLRTVVVVFTGRGAR